MNPGDVIGNYELLEQVGAGAMGDVFRARQISMNRIVALKILPERLAEDRSFVKRFVREARSAGKCSHANLIQVYDVGSSGGTYYFSMEFVGGPTLHQILQERGPLPETEAVSQMSNLAGALGEAHARGIVHRDVKPANVILTERGEPKLADLGLAKPVGAGAEETNAGKPLGTPYYMSPEQARGQKLDGRADLYALGATFYHLLSGETLFSGPNPTAVMARHITEKPPRLRELRRDVSRGLEAVIMKLLEKDPDARHADARALIEDLKALAAGRRLVHAEIAIDTARYRPGASVRSSAPARRGVGFWLAAAAVPVAVLATALILFARGGKETAPPPVEPALEAAAAQADEERPGRPKTPSTRRRPAADDREKRGAKLFAQAESLAAEHPDDYGAAIQRFYEVVLAARGSSSAGKAEARMNELRSAWKRVATAALGEAVAEARARLDSADYDAALARLGQMPPELASQVEPETERERESIRQAAERRIDDIFAAAESHLKQGNPDVARKVLGALSGVRYAPGVAAAAGRVAALTRRIGVVGKEKQQAVEEAVRERLADILAEFEAHVKAGLYAEARELVQRAASGVRGGAGETLSAASRVARALEARRRRVKMAVSALAGAGEDVAFATTGGARKGKIEAVTEEGVELSAEITSGRQVIGRTRLKIAWSDLSPEQEDRLARGWSPENPDGHMALALLALCREDARSAEQAVERAGEHPLAEYVRDRSAQMTVGPVEAAARRAWRRIEDRASARPLAAARARTLLAQIKRFREKHGMTAYAGSIAEGVDTTRALAERALSSIAGLVGHWKFDEGRGQRAADSSGNESHGTVTGARWVRGIHANALDFDGKSSEVTVAGSDACNLGTADFSIAAWIRSRGEGTFVAKSPADGSWQRGGKILYVRGGRFEFDAHSSGAVASRTRVDDGRWHHAAVTFESEGKTVRLYVDGSPDGMRRLALLPDVPGHVVRIGHSPRGCFGKHNFDGAVDDVRIYSRALSEADVKALAASAAGVRPGR